MATSTPTQGPGIGEPDGPGGTGTGNGSGGDRWWPALVVVLVVVVLVGIGVLVRDLRTRDDAAPVASPGATTDTSGPSPSTTKDAPEPEEAGCAMNDVTAPTGADTVTVIDVDGDGRPDQAWISGGADRRFGITTASGATFSVAIDSASPIGASAVVSRIQADDQPIALVDLGREALVYSLSECAVTPVANAQGQPYTFDRGFGEGGTGVGCSGTGTLQLAGLDAVAAADGTYSVTRTFVTLDADGRKATNGSAEQVATGAAATDPVVTTAQEVSCGDLVAGKVGDGPIEPAQ